MTPHLLTCCGRTELCHLNVLALLQDPLTPYDEVFGLERFRECELIHGRWAMVAVLGCLIGEASTGVSWCAPGIRFSLYLSNRLRVVMCQQRWLVAAWEGSFPHGGL